MNVKLGKKMKKNEKCDCKTCTCTCKNDECKTSLKLKYGLN